LLFMVSPFYEGLLCYNVNQLLFEAALC